MPRTQNYSTDIKLKRLIVNMFSYYFLCYDGFITRMRALIQCWRFFIRICWWISRSYYLHPTILNKLGFFLYLFLLFRCRCLFYMLYCTSLCFYIILLTLDLFGWAINLFDWNYLNFFIILILFTKIKGII